MIIEAAVALGSGLVANSLVHFAFGIDSVIEIASAAVLLWRLKVEPVIREGGGEGRIPHGRRLAPLACRLRRRCRRLEALDAAGCRVLVLAIPIMYVLSRRKLELAQQLGSRALRADAIESITCGWLAFVVVAALAAQILFGAWWVDAIASLAIVYVLIQEGREAWKGEEHCDRI